MVTLQQLCYFRALAKSGHLTRTAEQMHVTQSTLSNTILHLERQVGVKLFDRAGRAMRLSEAGKVYYKYVSRALALLDNAQIAVDDFRQDGAQAVSVAMTSPGIWSGLIHRFRTRYPDHSLRQIGCGSEQSRQMLMEQELDFVICGSGDFALTGLKHRVIRTERLYLCVPPEHPLAGRESVRLGDAAGERFIDLPAGNAFRAYCDALFQKLGIRHVSTLECDYTLRGELVRSGFGVALTTGTAMRQKLLGGENVYLPVTDEQAVRPILIVWDPRRRLSRAAEDFRELVMETEGEG